MKKILIEYERNMPTVNVLVNQLETFARRYGCTLLIKPSIDITSQNIRWSDVVISIRGSSPLSDRIARIAKKAARFHIYYLDDYLLEPPDGFVMLASRKSSIRRILSVTDVVLSTTTLLAGKLGEISKTGRFVTLNTVVNEVVSPERPSPDCIRILYAGNVAHVAVFNKYIKPVLPQLCEEFGNRISFTFIAIRPDLTDFEDKIPIKYIQGMPFAEYREFMRNNHFEIGLAPLESGGFSQYKYYNKFIEYASHGILGMYSNCLPFNLIIKDQVNGLLCDNTLDGWLQSFRIAINQHDLRERIVDQAQNQLREEFTEQRINEKLQSNIPELTDYSADKDKIVSGMIYAKIIYAFFRFWEILYLVIMYTRSIGLVKMFRKAVNNVVMKKREGIINKISGGNQ